MTYQSCPYTFSRTNRIYCFVRWLILSRREFKNIFLAKETLHAKICAAQIYYTIQQNKILPAFTSVFLEAIDTTQSTRTK